MSWLSTCPASVRKLLVSVAPTLRRAHALPRAGSTLFIRCWRTDGRAQRRGYPDSATAREPLAAEALVGHDVLDRRPGPPVGQNRRPRLSLPHGPPRWRRLPRPGDWEAPPSIVDPSRAAE